MCEATSDALKIEIMKDFKDCFNVDLTEDDFTEVDDGFEIDYRDYNLNNIDKYHHSSLIEHSRIEMDGRESYIIVNTYLTYEDYFGV